MTTSRCSGKWGKCVVKWAAQQPPGVSPTTGLREISSQLTCISCFLSIMAVTCQNPTTRTLLVYAFLLKNLTQGFRIGFNWSVKLLSSKWNLHFSAPQPRCREGKSGCKGGLCMTQWSVPTRQPPTNLLQLHWDHS